MKLIKFQGRLPECVEGFAEDAERSCEGALHLRPGQTAELTDDEYAHLKAQRPEVAKDVVLLREWKAPAKKAEAAPAPEAKAEAKAEAPAPSKKSK